MKTSIESAKAPAPIGPYSQAIRTGNTLYISGQIAINRENDTMITEDIQSETRQVMKNLEAILNEAGLSFDEVVKSSIFIKDMGDFQKINEIYGGYFNSIPPARETVQVSGLPKGVNVEISCIAVK